MMSCTICQNNERLCEDGIVVAENEVIPFFKKELLNLRYPDHPFPMRFIKQNLTSSCYAFGQLVHHLKHVERGDNAFGYYTSNPTFLKYADQIAAKFGILIKSSSEAPAGCPEVCEFNIEP